MAGGGRVSDHETVPVKYHVDYSNLPAHMQDGMRRYIEHGFEPGGFAMAVLQNDLVGAFQRADRQNRVAMETWASWLWNECPASAWGSVEIVTKWMRARREDASR